MIMVMTVGHVLVAITCCARRRDRGSSQRRRGPGLLRKLRDWRDHLGTPPGGLFASLSALGSTGKCGQEIIRELAGVCRAGCLPS